MPERLTPGVNVDEMSSRAKSIEGVPTSTFGMAGRTEYGPVPYTLVTQQITMTPKPVLLTSYAEYERLFGGLGSSGEPIYLAHAARSFFENGGRRLYVSRVFSFAPAQAGGVDVDKNFASFDVGAPAVATWRARWPGQAGEKISVQVDFVRGDNVWVGAVKALDGVHPGAAVELGDDPAKPPSDTTAPMPSNIRIVDKLPDGRLGFRKADGIGAEPVPPTTAAAFHLTLDVTVGFGDDRTAVYSGLELERPHPIAIGNVLQVEDPSDDGAVLWLDRKDAPTLTESQQLLAALLAEKDPVLLSGTDPDIDLTADDLKGKDSDPDDPINVATGLAALGDRDDIAIVACPDTVTLDAAAQPLAVSNVLGHCEKFRYRFAIVDPPKGSSISDVRAFRSQFDSDYGALYYPWIRIADPTVKNDPAPPATLDLPPSGVIAGIYARSDIEHGVHRAPADQVVRGMTKLVFDITDDRQSALNAEGINALRFFEGRGNRVWGARTTSSDPEWKYVNVRRLFIYLEHSIDKSTQWAVFEPNNEQLWTSIRRCIEDFLLAVWRSGALVGTKPEEAFFVRCDRTTMTQSDLDDGRLICLIGVAAIRPAEFVIFRIGQWTADANQG